MAGVRIFDVSNPKAPKLVKNVQTCKGSHTHTLVPSPTDPRRSSTSTCPDSRQRDRRRSWPGARTARTRRTRRTRSSSSTSSRCRSITPSRPRSSRARASSPASMPAPECKHVLRSGARPAAMAWPARTGDPAPVAAPDAHRPAQLPRRDGVPGDAPARRRLLEPLHHGRHLEPREAGAAVRPHRHQQLPGPAYGRRSATTARRSS